jgi:hypothetical protein
LAEERGKSTSVSDVRIFRSSPQNTPPFHFHPLQPDFEAIGPPKGYNKDHFRGHFIANFDNQGDYIGNSKTVGNNSPFFAYNLGKSSSRTVPGKGFTVGEMVRTKEVISYSPEG